MLIWIIMTCFFLITQICVMTVGMQYSTPECMLALLPAFLQCLHFLLNSCFYPARNYEQLLLHTFKLLGLSSIQIK